MVKHPSHSFSMKGAPLNLLKSTGSSPELSALIPAATGNVWMPVLVSFALVFQAFVAAAIPVELG